MHAALLRSAGRPHESRPQTRVASQLGRDLSEKTPENVQPNAIGLVYAIVPRRLR